MARIGTTFLNLGKWLDGENPGSGPQDGTLSDGLNGDKNKIDAALGTQHNADGSHKAGVIDCTNLKATVADGLTLEQDASSKKLRLKDAAVTVAKLASDVIALFTAQTSALTAHKSSADHDAHNDERYAQIGATGMEILASFEHTTENPYVWGTISGRTCSQSIGPSVPAGVITRIIATKASGDVVNINLSIAIPDLSIVSIKDTDGDGLINLYINSAVVAARDIGSSAAYALIIVRPS